MRPCDGRSRRRDNCPEVSDSSRLTLATKVLLVVSVPACGGCRTARAQLRAHASVSPSIVPQIDRARAQFNVNASDLTSEGRGDGAPSCPRGSKESPEHAQIQPRMLKGLYCACSFCYRVRRYSLTRAENAASSSGVISSSRSRLAAKLASVPSWRALIAVVQ